MSGKYYVRLYYVNGGFVDKLVPNTDLTQLQVPKDVYRIKYRESEAIGSTLKNANYYIGEIVTREDAIAGQVKKDSLAYSWLISGIEKEMLRTPFGVVGMEKPGIVLSQNDFDENGYYIGCVQCLQAD